MDFEKETKRCRGKEQFQGRAIRKDLPRRLRSRGQSRVTHRWEENREELVQRPRGRAKERQTRSCRAMETTGYFLLSWDQWDAIERFQVGWEGGRWSELSFETLRHIFLQKEEQIVESVLKYRFYNYLGVARLKDQVTDIIEKIYSVMLRDPERRGLATPRGLYEEAPGSVRRQREWGENADKSPYCGYTSWGLTSLNNFDKLWGIGAISSCQVLGPRWSRQVNG